MYFYVIIIKLLPVIFVMIFSKIRGQFRIRIRIHNLELRIRILRKVSDPYGSGSTTMNAGNRIGYSSTNILVAGRFYGQEPVISAE
jgi:hypothetical protein